MKTLIKYLMIAVLGFGLTMPQAALAQRSRVRIGGGQSSSKPKPESKPRSNHRPAQAPTLADQTFTVNGVTFRMIGVQGGTFTMGATAEQGCYDADDEKPVHRVTLSSFLIGQTEVTQKLWQAVMNSNPSCFSGNPNHPVELVSWNDCQEFINRLNELTGENFRLPTESEWEFAARGGKKSQGYKYSGSNDIGTVAWYYGNSYALGYGDIDYGTHDVATKQPNELGLYDMSGNVWEWCQDWYGSYCSSPLSNPSGPASGSYRVCRGGCWCDYDSLNRVSWRNYYKPDCRDYFHGLRLAL